VTACLEFLQNPNPRYHSCARCGRVQGWHSDGIVTEPQPGAVRDRLFEEQALRLVGQRAAHPTIERLAVERLDWGDREYGRERKTWDADGVQEAMDEAVDGIAWLLLDIQNRDVDGDVREYVMRACTAFAEAHRELCAARSLILA
jgi:hypothetical protein